MFEYQAIKKIQNSDLLILWLKIYFSSCRQKDGQRTFSVSNIELTDNVLSACFERKDNQIGGAIYCLEKEKLLKREKTRLIVFVPWETKRDRNSLLYKQWRSAVFQRDNYTCQSCGSRKNLQAHHIVYWRDCVSNPELRYDIENGITLCRKCHLKAHKGTWRG